MTAADLHLLEQFRAEKSGAGNGGGSRGSMRIRLTLRRDPADAKDLAVTVDGLATVADVATQLWAADPARRGTPPPSNLTLSIEEAFAAGRH